MEELDDRKSIASAVIKRFVAGNTVQVEDKFGDPQDMIPSARVMISTNQELLIEDNSDALKRRIIILPFTKQVKEKDKNTDLDTDDYWIDELSGIRNWALRGLSRLVANKWHFTESPLMEEALKAFSSITNPQQKFLHDYIEFSPNDHLFGAEMYSKYKDHCFHYGIVPVRDSVFSRDIIKAFPFVIKTPNALTYKKGRIKLKSHVFHGIRFKSDSTSDEVIQSRITAQQEQVY